MSRVEELTEKSPSGSRFRIRSRSCFARVVLG